MAKFKVKLLRRREVAERTMAFHFDKPAGFAFKAGQSMDVTLLDPPETDAEGNTRTFSIASVPGDAELMIATRMRDTAFKRVLKSAPLGFLVEIEGPMGSFTLHKDAKKPAVFLAGGIGITPFLSIIGQAAADRVAHELTLFYSNRRPEDAAFLDELQALASAGIRLRLVPTMTETQNSRRPWSGERSMLDGPFIARHVGDLKAPSFYLAGPPAMVTALREALATAGAEEDNVRSEEFSGY